MHVTGLHPTDMSTNISPLNHYAWWQNLLILSVILLACIYAAPNLYQSDPAIQVSSEDSRQELEAQTADKALQAIKEANIEVIAFERTPQRFVYRLRDGAQQLRARTIVQNALGAGYIVALNKASNTPEWLRKLGAGALSLGLDLSGGVHFSLEVDVDSYVRRRMENAATDMRRTLLKARVRVRMRYDEQTQQIVFTFKSNADLDKGSELLSNDYVELGRNTVREQEPQQAAEMTFSLPDNVRQQYVIYAVEQNVAILRNRVNELGVSEPLVQRQGRNRIVVELPGVQDTAQAKRVLGKFANLEFRLAPNSQTPSFARRRFDYRNSADGSDWLEEELIITGDSVSNATSGFDENGQAMVGITLDTDGGIAMNQATRSNVGRRMGVLFVEQRTRVAETKSRLASKVAIGEKYDDKTIISMAVIRSVLGTQFQIEGLDSVSEAVELALLLRSGALSAPLEFVEERTVGPSLGAANIRAGVRSVILGMCLVLAFMIFWYRGFGWIANSALVVNLLLLVAIMSSLSATLTLPGIAGIVLTVGMAVDANVLIYSRIHEEWRNGLSPQQAIHSGYNRALVTILDANITTLLVAFILYFIGTGPVRGFAITLSIGILTSMFTAIFGTRALVNGFYGKRHLTQLKMGLTS